MKNSKQHQATTTSKTAKGRGLRQTAASLGLLLLLGVSAAAQTPIGPFSGQYDEDFESSTTIMSGYAPNSVLGGNGTYHTASAGRTNSWGFGCSMMPHAGIWFVGDNGGLMWFEFNTAPARFGGYFGSNQPGARVSVDVRFFSASNTLLSSTTRVLQNDCTWQWLGWDTPGGNVRRIEFETTTAPGFLMMDDLELDLTSVNTCATAFCFGDGSAGTFCPCGNSGASGEGCANATGSGATLSFVGSCSISVNNAGLIAGNLPQYRWALFFEGGSVIGAGSIPFFDGVLCVGGPYLGLQFVMSGPLGVAQTTIDLASPPGLPGVFHSPGETTYYQCFYNTPGGSSVCGTNWNLTNAIEVLWTP